ncbi:MAG TPA: hypothetical protein EYH34_04870 [Planctomycetes bacterium]|nr:hypothetical protein [Planctomycetota bacterium]
MDLKSGFGLILLLVVSAAGQPSLAFAAGALQAGVAVEPILTDRPTVPVHDPLYAKALVLSDGERELAIAALDIIGVNKSLADEIRSRLRSALGLKPSHVLVTATHNHHTQGQVADDLVERVVKAVRRAREQMVPVRIGAGTGHEDRIVMNRRLLLQDGGQWTIRRANPSPRDDEVAKLGPVDPQIGVLRIDRTDGRVLAVLYNYAVHAYGGAPDGGVTADLPGAASAFLEESLGPGAVAIFLQGAAGDITPIRYKDVDAPPPTQQLGMTLGLSTLRAVHRIRTEPAGRLLVTSETIVLPRRSDLQEKIAALEAQQEKILQFFTGIGCGAHGAGTFLNFKTFLPLYLKHTVDPEHPAYSSYLYLHESATGRHDLKHLDAENRRRLQKYLESIHKMEELIRLRSNLQLLQRQLARKERGEIRAEIQAIRIGPLALITFPGEPYCEIGLRIKQRSPFKHTFLVSYVNGHVGYAPTADSYDTVCYENSHTPLAPQWQAIYEAAAQKLLRAIADE